jgi:hypothetical protein
MFKKVTQAIAVWTVAIALQTVINSTRAADDQSGSNLPPVTVAAVVQPTVPAQKPSTLSGSGQPSGLEFTPISPEVTFQTGPEAADVRRFTRRHFWALAHDSYVMSGTTRAVPHSTYRLVQACAGFHNECSNSNINIARCCEGFVCVSNPNANGRTWCEGMMRPHHAAAALPPNLLARADEEIE